MQRKTSNLLPILIALTLIGVIAYAVSTQLSIDNNGTVIGVVAYPDDESTTPLETIEWGGIIAGGTAIKEIYIESTLTEDITITFTTTDLPTDFVITCAPTIPEILVGERILVTLTLIVPDDTETASFTFQTNFNAVS